MRCYVRQLQRRVYLVNLWVGRILLSALILAQHMSSLI
jgi:hypothetical protein